MPLTAFTVFLLGRKNLQSEHAMTDSDKSETSIYFSSNVFNEDGKSKESAIIQILIGTISTPAKDR